MEMGGFWFGLLDLAGNLRMSNGDGDLVRPTGTEVIQRAQSVGEVVENFVVCGQDGSMGSHPGEQRHQQSIPDLQGLIKYRLEPHCPVQLIEIEFRVFPEVMRPSEVRDLQTPHLGVVTP